MILSSRDRDVLEILIADYIASAQPVGSSAIAKRHPAHLSPATIRSIMSDLEERGYLAKPHTSAGRIPTEHALRFYVDRMLNVRDLDAHEQERIRAQYQGAEVNIEVLLRRTSKILSAISRYAGIVASPHAEQLAFKHIEFLPLSRRRLLGIFVAQNGMVQNRIIECDEEFTYPELERINNYCNRVFLGLTLSEARDKARVELADEQTRYDRMFMRAMLMSQQLLDEVPDGELLIEGEEKLLGTPAFAHIDALKHVLDAIDEKHRILELLDRSRENEGVKIFIGAESGFPIEGMSMVTAPYHHGGKIIGTLGVIGPTRMDYSRVIPIVDFTSKLISDLINA